MGPLNLIDYHTGCVCYDHPPCICDDTERLIRARIAHRAGIPPLTKGERAQIAEDAEAMATGLITANEILAYPDADLARAWLDASVSFARKHGFL